MSERGPAIVPEARAVTMKRLVELLEAYGAAPERWPESERAAAEELLARSDAARALQREAAALDRLLDALPPVAPSAVLRDRVLAAAPKRRPAALAWRRALTVAVPLAAAASLVLWFAVRDHASKPAVQVASRDAATGSAVTGSAAPLGADSPARHAVQSTTTVALGELTSPTDALLEPIAIDVSSAMPSVGCADSTLGCPKVEGAVDPYSEAPSSRRRFA